MKKEGKKGNNQPGENSANINNNTSMAEEMAAFSNFSGGLIIVGVKDNGEISNVASEHVKPPINTLTQGNRARYSKSFKAL